MKKCFECGEDVSGKDIDYCPYCGSKTKKGVKRGETRKVNWTLTLIMSIFFGSLGVDRFIMGHVWLGILKLLTMGGCGIWWLIDLILIVTKHPFKNIEWVS